MDGGIVARLVLELDDAAYVIGCPFSPRSSQDSAKAAKHRHAAESRRRTKSIVARVGGVFQRPSSFHH